MLLITFLTFFVLYDYMASGSKKKTDKIIILSVIIGGLILGGAISYAKLSSSGVIQFMNEKMNIPKEMLNCSTGQSCVVVETRCDFCCDYVAINSIYEQQYDQIFSRNCSFYNKETCDCYDLTRYPACIKGKCELVKWPDAKETSQKQ